jgi:hypothetical protein
LHEYDASYSVHGASTCSGRPEMGRTARAAGAGCGVCGAGSVTGAGAYLVTGAGAHSVTGAGAYLVTGAGACSATGAGADSVTGAGAGSATPRRQIQIRSIELLSPDCARSVKRWAMR